MVLLWDMQEHIRADDQRAVLPMDVMRFADKSAMRLGAIVASVTLELEPVTRIGVDLMRLERRQNAKPCTTLGRAVMPQLVNRKHQ
jgi:hypothetical protein